MIFRFFTFLYLLFACYSESYTQQLPDYAGSRAAALGNATVALADIYALHYNTAALAQADTLFSVSFGATKNFNIEGFSTQVFQIVLPVKNVMTGFALKRSGDALYNETKVIGGFAHQVRNVALGGSIQFFQVGIKDYGTKSNVLFDFGGLITFSRQLKVGAYMYNLTQAELKGDAGVAEPLPVVMKAGLAYQPILKVLVLYELNKQVQYSVCHKLGLEYMLSGWCKVRGGLNTNPYRYHAGFGVRKSFFDLDLSFQWNKILGNTGGLTLVYHLQKGLLR